MDLTPKFNADSSRDSDVARIFVPIAQRIFRENQAGQSTRVAVWSSAVELSQQGRRVEIWRLEKDSLHAHLFADGVEFGRADSGDLEILAMLCFSFLAARDGLAILKRRYPIFKESDAAAVHEQGAEAEVAHRWQSFLEDPFPEELKMMQRAMIELSKTIPFCRLSPVTSLDLLSFSRFTGHPCGRGFPGIRWDESGQYAVWDLRDSGVEVGRGDLEWAIATMKSLLPPGELRAEQGYDQSQDRDEGQILVPD